MLIESTHTISDEQALRSALAGQAGPPQGVKLRATLLRRDRSHLTCVWEAPSVDAVRNYVEGKIGKLSKSNYYELDESGTTGLAPAGASMSTNVSLLHEIGKQLARSGRAQEALAIFQLNAEQNPGSWFTVAGLARGYAAVGDRSRALQTLRTALERAPAHRREHVQRMVSQLESGQSLN